MVRELARRCNYDREHLFEAEIIIQELLLSRRDYGIKPEELTSLVLVEDFEGLSRQPTHHLQSLLKLIHDCLGNRSFPVVTNHDEYRCHANNCNRMRQVWIDVMADIADSNMAQDILNELMGTNGTLVKDSQRCGELIRGSNYGVC